MSFIITPALPSPGPANQVLVSTGSAWTSSFVPYTNYYKNTFSAISSTTFTVPAATTSIRAYAVGKGGDAALFATQRAQGGAGGGFAFGDIAVTPGAIVTITINASSTTVSIGGITYLTANAGATPTVAGTAAAGGTASIHSSVTNGNAYSGGSGSNTTANYQGGSGGSAGSPLGNGYNGVSSASDACGGAGIGKSGTVDGYGGGAGAAGSDGAGGSGTTTTGNSPYGRAVGSSRSILNKWPDPLMQYAVSAGLPQSADGFGTWYAIAPFPGAGGAPFTKNSGGYTGSASYAGDFGGGGGASMIGTASGTIFAMSGGFLGGGGSAYSSSSNAINLTGGNGGYGGGGGGAFYASASPVGTATQGFGNVGAVVIFY